MVVLWKRGQPAPGTRPLWDRRRQTLLVALLLCSGGSARAETSNFDFSGRIYTKYLYGNDDSQGALWYGNPFWPDDIAGRNGVATEFEMTIKARVSDAVQAGVRMASRYGELWQDWWESGNYKYGQQVNTSGDSLGLNHASYMKLRGAWVRWNPELPLVDLVHVGASDMGTWNAWTIGRIRYIDRDNGKGFFIDGHFDEERSWTWNLGAVALPKLWVGPGWSSGVGDPVLKNPFWSRDWAYAGKLTWAAPGARVVAIGTMTQDLEADPADPDALGSLYPNCKDAGGARVPGCYSDHAVDFYSRFWSTNATLEGNFDPLEHINLNLLVGFAKQRIDPRFASNGVAINQGVSPVVFDDVSDGAAKLRLDIEDAVADGLKLKLEYFNIGQHWNAIFGQRREGDVLLTDGLVEGGQLPTLNLANEFIDFDEDWYESCIGWHGGTAVTEYAQGPLDVSAEYTFLSYNTNAQRRDVDKIYPDFLHSDGFTDTDLYSYANPKNIDRGRDPRSVYRRNQNRRTHIGVVKGRYTIDVGRGLDLSLKGKFIRDEDFRSDTTYDDDYRGDMATLRAKASMPVSDGVRVAVGGQVDRWGEKNRAGTLETGYGNGTTKKEKIFAQLSYDFKGVRLKYHLEYIHKDLLRPRDGDETWKVWRSKATLEVAW